MPKKFDAKKPRIVYFSQLFEVLCNRAASLRMEHAEAVHATRMELQARVNEKDLRISELRAEREQVQLELGNERVRILHRCL